MNREQSHSVPPVPPPAEPGHRNTASEGTGGTFRRRIFLAGALLIWLGRIGWLAGRTELPTTAPAEKVNLGPDTVVLRELSDRYEAVPFDHRSHAKMSQMWYGCVTCHHRTPDATTRPAGIAPPHQQEASAAVPACKSCHAAKAADADADLRMPSLKGAYHRQCLNCHKEWMHGNACVVCHKPRSKGNGGPPPTRDDVVGRMHPPIPEPETKLYKARFTPADGANVLFRHKEHTNDFGLRCVACHHRDNCSHCHDPSGDKSAQKPVRPGMTWAESHGPCMGCHQQDRCQHCHYKDEEQAPVAFAHAMTGQDLDKDHLKLSCLQCHARLQLKATPTCGDSACHKDPSVLYPVKRPGPTTRPLIRPTTRKVRPGSDQVGWAQPAQPTGAPPGLDMVHR